ncbi:transcriptional regulator [Nocardia yamanashiensis]|uniref:PaaX family transcriptional regulator C-terminal domain-containing protein n=1 Tax=Nocardia yamanashiensis TaxID=209247 RepID=UPI001E4E9DBA|nr:PaaX family transcriptional regulator C-terminal domain-containing protein [Nocardia yamanashiensis]UGT40936.1 transcriptional regulator [Nocardia yamanashiensis]
MVGDREDGTEVPTRTLVESMIREDSTIDAGELYAVGNALGMSDQQVRLCVRRLVADGQFTQEGRGRKALLRAGDKMRRSIEPELEYLRYMYAQDRGDAPWDGVWHVVAFAVPETERQGRDAMRDAIGYLGGAAIQGGLYVSPNAWEDRIADAAGEFGVGEYISTMTTTDLRIGRTDGARELAARLWPLDRLAAEHDRLLRFARRQLDRLHDVQALTDTERTTIAVELAAEFSRVMDPDPLLPPELLPAPWIGAEARAVVAQCWSELLRAEQPDAIRLFRVYSDVLREAAAR